MNKKTFFNKNKYPDLDLYIARYYISDEEFEEELELCLDECVYEPSISMAPDRCEAMAVRECSSYDAYIEENENALKARMEHLADTFQEYLFYLIELKGLKAVDVYKRAIIDKRQFSKIKNNPDYHPDKATALRLCVGVCLNLDETKDLLARAGYAISPCDKRDIIFAYFIEKEIYDMIEIDIALEAYGLPTFIG